MQKDILPPELACKWGHLQFVRRVSPIEYHAECPVCGDEDHETHDWPNRFIMRTDGKARGWCRRCKYQAFIDDDRPGTITPEMRLAWVEERLERARQAKAKIEQTIALLQREQVWLRYHNALTTEAILWWSRKGVDCDTMSYLKLGWCESRTFWDGQMEFSTPTATIPVFSPGWQIQTIRHRLIRPASEGDKYRPDRSGLPASLYYANPQAEIGGQCLIVEGEIKAIVTSSRLGIYEDDHADFFVVGTPGKSFRKDILDGIKAKCDRVVIVLDPDAKQQAWDTARFIGKAARVVYLPCKPDDFFVEYGGTRRDFESALRYGRQL